MPKIDPVTGCKVMTMLEFLAAEGKREDKDPGDILSEIFQDMDNDSKCQEQSILQNPAEFLKTVMKICQESVKDWESEVETRKAEDAERADGYRLAWARESIQREFLKTLKAYQQHREHLREVYGYNKPIEPKPFMPVSIVKMLTAQCSQGFSSSKTSISAEVICDDGKVRIAKLAESHWSGTRLDPPESDENLEWEEVLVEEEKS